MLLEKLDKETPAIYVLWMAGNLNYSPESYCIYSDKNRKYNISEDVGKLLGLTVHNRSVVLPISQMNKYRHPKAPGSINLNPYQTLADGLAVILGVDIGWYKL